MLNKLLSAFAAARKAGSFNKETRQEEFTFTFPELGIDNVHCLLHKEALDKRYKVLVLMNLDDRRTIIFPEDNVDRVRCIIGVCAPIDKFDTIGHRNRENLRKSVIENVREEMRKAHFNEALSVTNAPKEICEELNRQVSGKYSAQTYQLCEELRRYPIDFADLKKMDTFTYVLYASCCMIVEHFTFEQRGKQSRPTNLPSAYFFQYVADQRVDRLPTHIANVKHMLAEQFRAFGSYRFYHFCNWFADLCSKVPGHEREVMLTMEERRFEERQAFAKQRRERRENNFGSNKQSAPSEKSEKKFNKPAAKTQSVKEQPASKPENNPPKKKQHPQTLSEAGVKGLTTLGAIFEQQLGELDLSGNDAEAQNVSVTITESPAADESVKTEEVTQAETVEEKQD